MSTFRRLLRLHRPHLGVLLLGLGLSLLVLLANVVLMATSGWFIAAMGLAGAAGVTMNYFTPAAIIRACAIVRTTGRYGERLLTHDATLRLLSRLRVWLYDIVEPLAPAGLETHRGGELLSRFTADIDTLDNFYLRILLPLGVALLAALIMIAWLAWQAPAALPAFTALLLLAGLLLPALLARRAGHAEQQAQLHEEALRTLSSDALAGLDELILHGADQALAQRLHRTSRRLAAAQRRAARWSGAGDALVTLCAWLALWQLLVLGIPEVTGGLRPPAELAMLCLFALAAFEAVAPLPRAFQALAPTLAAARRLFELADQPPPLPEPPQAPQPAHLDLRCHELSFTYPGAPRPALAAIDLHLPAGTHLAIVGPSGCGKSTLLQLLTRLRLPDGGRLEIGGVPIQAWPGTALRRRVVLVEQRPHLFIGTLADNLRLARPDADDEALRAACRIAQLDAWLARLPQGLATEVGEAALAISGGEARRLAVARALLAEPEVLLLDEPTEGLDGATAEALLDALHRTMAKGTLILVTHRAEALARMDRVVLMDQGRLIAQGSHEELLAHSAPYRALVAKAP